MSERVEVGESAREREGAAEELELESDALKLLSVAGCRPGGKWCDGGGG